jgi:hypothetical protein
MADEKGEWGQLKLNDDEEPDFLLLVAKTEVIDERLCQGSYIGGMHVVY